MADSEPATVPVTGLPASQSNEDAAKPREPVARCLYDRERIMNDMTNTGTVGALVGGFALSIFDRPFSLDSLEFSTGIIIFLSVHLCTFSALSSAIIYRRVNAMVSPTIRLHACGAIPGTDVAHCTARVMKMQKSSP
eukprot:3048959-Rhodomonas_salina.1